MTSERPSKILILTALPVERDAVVRRLSNIRSERHSTGIEYQIGNFGSLTVCVAQIAPGNTSAALETERAIRFFEPDVAFFVGIAGGVKDVTLGDVVAATKVYGYEAGADRNHFQPRPDVGLSSYPLIKGAENIARKGNWLANVVEAEQDAIPHVFVGPIAAGAKVVKSTRGAVAKLLKEHYGDALAVEMEGEGFLRAAYTNKVDAIVVRGISDLLKQKDVSDSSGWQEIASERAAAFAFELIANLVRETVVDFVTKERDESDRTSIVRDSVGFWPRLRELASRLYPRGPASTSLWEDAGGDLSYLDLSSNARTQWSRAIRQLENGGGGAQISTTSLLDRMLQEFAKNYELQYLRALVNDARGDAP
jgi:nucleoside phosphorylase